jgi:hypothetical protein
MERRNGVAMVLVDGGMETEGVLWRIATGRGRFDGTDGRIIEFEKVDGSFRGGLVVKRRYWFESMGVPIGNLIML